MSDILADNISNQKDFDFKQIIDLRKSNKYFLLIFFIKLKLLISCTVF
jgi:hypothetical protein